MESPTPGNHTGTQGEASARRHDPRHSSVLDYRFPLVPIFNRGTLHELLTEAAEARRHGDHGAADLLEHNAILMVRATPRDEPRGMA